MFKSFVTAVSLFSFIGAVVAQDNTAVDIEAIQAHFSQAGIVPSLLTTFDPSALLTVSFDGVGDISPGQPLTQDQVQPTPSLTVTPANSSITLPTGNYTIVMVDAGPVGTDESQGQTRHWLANGITLSGSPPNETVSNTSAVAITEYAGPAPPSGSGPHRYVILLYSQPDSFTPPANFSQPNIGVSVFSLSDYVQSSGLGPIIAGSYFTVEVGTATASLSATSPVETSTLPIPTNSPTGTNTKAPTSSSTPKSNGAFAFSPSLNLLSLALVPVLAIFAN